MVIKYCPASQALGAVISGIDLAKPIDGKTVGALKEIWAENLVMTRFSAQISFNAPTVLPSIGFAKSIPEITAPRACDAGQYFITIIGSSEFRYAMPEYSAKCGDVFNGGLNALEIGAISPPPYRR